MKRPATAIPSRYSRETVIAVIAIVAIALHLALRFAFEIEGTLLGFKWPTVPLLVALGVGGTPLVAGLAVRFVRFEFSSNLLAGISIVTAVILGEYLAGTIVVLMLSGGQALEAYAVGRASSALLALARRMPSQAHRKVDGALGDISLEQVAVGDLLVVFPHETCPVDALVVEGNSTMDESYLTGEPYVLSKVVSVTSRETASLIMGVGHGRNTLTSREIAFVISTLAVAVVSASEFRTSKPHPMAVAKSMAQFLYDRKRITGSLTDRIRKQYTGRSSSTMPALLIGR